MKADRTDLLGETLLLLELALIIGRMSGYDLAHRCHEFLRILLARKNLSYGSVWIRGDVLDRNGDPDSMVVIKALPESRLAVREVARDHPAIAALGTSRFLVINSDTPDYADHVLGVRPVPGSLVFFRLGDIGMLRLHSRDPGGFLTREANQLYNVIEAFTISLEGALSQMRFHQEIEERKQVEEKLHQADRLKALGQLTGGIAHDFNNLLAVIQGCAEFLELSPDHDAELVGSILDATNRGAELTHRLLAYARQQPLKAESFNMSHLIDGMKTMLRRTLGHEIAISFRADSDLRYAVADPRQVEDALLNLAINARDAMPDGGTLTIECANACFDADHPEIDQGEYVMLAVSDTGTGMPPDVQERVFEPFFTTKEAGAGNGLGLSTIYGFAKQSGGHLSLYSEPGIGTTFQLYLPVASSGPAAESTDISMDVEEGRGEHILVLEDDPAVRRLTLRTLTALNYTADGVGEVEDARRRLRNGSRIDLLLSDVALPGGTSGPHFAAEIRAERPDLKVIFMSGFPPEAVRNANLLLGDDVLLNKPFRRQDLARTLRALLRDRDAGLSKS